MGKISEILQESCLKKKIKIKLKFIGAFPKKEENVEILEGTTYSQLLEILEINPEMVVVIKDGLPLPMDERVEEGEIKIIRVISGG